MLRRLAIITAVCTLLPTAAEAQICDDINTVSNGWNAVANALEETSGEDIGDLDVSRLENDVNTLLDPTQILGESLVDEGNEDEQVMGEDLLYVIEDLYDVSGEDLAAYLVDVIDDLVFTLDDIVDYCDAAER